MPHGRVCARCVSRGDLRRCGLCKGPWYCSIACQQAHWSDHKPFCTGAVIPGNALALLRSRSPPWTQHSPSPVSSAAGRAFGIPELLLIIVSLLPARDLLRAQRVCRAWYLTIALENRLQQRLFFAHGPGGLIVPARNGEEIHPAIHPRTEKQRRLLGYMDRWASDSAYLMILDSTSMHLTAREVEQTGTHIVLNPFFTMLWKQDPSEMRLNAYIRASAKSETASWRRMQLTSPPTRSVSMKLEYTDRKGSSKQLDCYTGRIPSGVTLGHIADELAAQPRSIQYHWMELQNHGSWRRSADAVVVPEVDMDDNVG